MNVNINQIYYDKKQLPLLDQAFSPYDNTENNNPEWREYYIFEKEYSQGKLFSQNDYVGFVSWKFSQKAKISGKHFIQFAKNNPGYDLYVLNPFPSDAYNYRNVWYQGENHHPGLIKITKYIFEQIGLGDYDFDAPHTIGVYSFCNFWIANEGFWKKYIEFGEKIKEVIENGLPLELKELIHKRADPVINSSYISFIYERLITSMLTHPSFKIKYLSFNYSRPQLILRYGQERFTNFSIFENLKKIDFPISKLNQILKDSQRLNKIQRNQIYQFLTAIRDFKHNKNVKKTSIKLTKILATVFNRGFFALYERLEKLLQPVYNFFNYQEIIYKSFPHPEGKLAIIHFEANGKTTLVEEIIAKANLLKKNNYKLFLVLYKGDTNLPQNFISTFDYSLIKKSKWFGDIGALKHSLYKLDKSSHIDFYEQILFAGKNAESITETNLANLNLKQLRNIGIPSYIGLSESRKFSYHFTTEALSFNKEFLQTFDFKKQIKLFNSEAGNVRHNLSRYVKDSYTNNINIDVINE